MMKVRYLVQCFAAIILFDNFILFYVYDNRRTVTCSFYRWPHCC